MNIRTYTIRNDRVIYLYFWIFFHQFLRNLCVRAGVWVCISSTKKKRKPDSSVFVYLRLVAKSLLSYLYY